MEHILILAIMVVSAFLLQTYLGLKQIKHFSAVYTEMRRNGRVAIGRKPGKVRAGTIVLLGLDRDANIIDARKLQGTSVIAKFKTMQKLVGINILELDINMPELKDENKMTRNTVMDAVDVYKKFINGEVIEEKKAPLVELKNKALSLIKKSEVKAVKK